MYESSSSTTPSAEAGTISDDGDGEEVGNEDDAEDGNGYGDDAGEQTETGEDTDEIEESSLSSPSSPSTTSTMATAGPGTAARSGASGVDMRGYRVSFPLKGLPPKVDRPQMAVEAKMRAAREALHAAALPPTYSRVAARVTTACRSEVYRQVPSVPMCVAARGSGASRHKVKPGRTS